MAAGYGIVVNSNVVGDTVFQQNAGGGSFQVNLGANQTWQNNSSSYVLSMNVPVTGAFSLTTNGAGTIVLGGSNSFSGGLTVSAGILRATHANALGSGAVTVSNTGALDIRAAVVKNIANSGTVSIGAGGNLSASSLGGALSLGGVSGTTATFTSTLGSGTLTLGSLVAGGNTNISLAAGSQVSASGAVNFTGASNLLSLTGAAAAPGVYTLIAGSTLSGTSGLSLTGGAVGNQTITLGSSGLVGRNTYAFGTSGNSLQLSVTGTLFNLTWNGGGSGTWNTTATNWQQDGAGSDIAFVDNDNVTIGTAAAIAVPNNVTAGTMAISNATGSVDLSGVGAVVASTLTKSGAGAATIANSGTVTNGLTVSAGSLSTTGPLAVTAGGLTVAGGTATLGAAGTVAGGITVNGGRLTLNAAQAVSGAVSISTAGVLALNSGTLGGGTLTLDNGTLAEGASVAAIGNPIAVGAGGATINNETAFELSGAITGSSNVLTKTGAGALTVSGAMGASKAGVQVNVNAGSLVFSGASVKELGGASVFNGNVTINNSTVTLSQNAGISGSGIIAMTGTSTINGRFGSSGGTKTISNPVSLDGTASLASASGINLALSGALSGSGAVTTSGAAKVSLSGTSAGGFAGSITVNNSSAGGYTDINTLAVDNATSIVINRNATLTGADGDLQISNTVQDELAAVISGAGILSIAAGTNRAILAGNNTFSGGSTLKGDVGIKTSAGLGTGAIASLGSGARIFWDGASTGVTLANNVSTGGTSSHAIAFAGTGKTWTLTGTISGSGQLKVSSGATLDLRSQTAAKSTYGGGLEIGTGSVIVDAADNLGSGGGAVNFGTGTASYLVVGGTGTNLTLSNSFTIGSASGNGYTANFDTNGNTLTVTSAIADKSGNANGGLLNKVGPGSLVLAGANTYTGTTTVSAGRLAVNGSLAAASSVTVLAGATLGGSGTIGGITAVAGIMAPGNSIGTLTVANDVVWNGVASAAGTTDWLFELGSANASDLLDIAGGSSDFMKNSTQGSVYRFDFGGSTNQGTFTLVSWGGTTDFLAGDFTYTNLGGGNTATFSIDGNALNVIVVPEPAAWVLAGLGVAVALGRRWRSARRRQD